MQRTETKEEREMRKAAIVLGILVGALSAGLLDA